jgi:molybdenum cofactor cytidylyltransferase
MKSWLYFFIRLQGTIQPVAGRVKACVAARAALEVPWRMKAIADCLVPAAGRSERMGAWKPILPFGDSTILGTVVETALRACPRVILVTGHRAAELASLFRAEPRVTVTENADWELGMFSSVRCGAALVGTDRFFVTLGDMPWIAPSVYDRLLKTTAVDAVFPEYNGRRGHPVLFNRRVIPAILAADPGSGSMREIAARFTVEELPWEDDSILRDIDTMEDYQ